jgi:osmotically-inducible protein OsmY
MKKPVLFMSLTCLLATTLLSGCLTTVVTTGAQAAYEHRSLQNTAHDHYQIVQVERAIHWKTDAYQNSRVSVSSFNNVILLTGQVPTRELREQLVPIAKSVPGVDEVHNLTVVSNRISTLNQLSDTWITAKVKARIIAANEIDPEKIKVITENGTVILIGALFPDQAEIAVDIARETSGVKSVVKVFTYLHASKKPLPEKFEMTG